MKWPRHQAIGFMVDFWTWAAQSCDDGQLQDFTDLEISFSAGCEKIDGILDALIQVGFVDDNPRRIHDWGEHQKEFIRAKYKRQPEKAGQILDMYRTCTGHVPDKIGNKQDKQDKQDNRTDIVPPKEATPSIPNCPHQEIIALYHKHLPMMPRVMEWTPARQNFLNTRWKEKLERQNLIWWENFFQYIAKSNFLCGRTKDPFTNCNLEWIVRSSNFVKIIEGNYENDKRRHN